MKLIIDNTTGVFVSQEILRHIAAEVWRSESIDIPCGASLTLIRDPDIQEVNFQQRGKDQATDVLSFPTLPCAPDRTAAQLQALLLQEWRTDLSCCWLGDILISVDRADAQAVQYGHSFERELGYLLVHGLLHLIGYDHMTAEDKTTMRDKEEAILRTQGLLVPDDEALLDAAKIAGQNAYAPYSGYRVGAALRTRDGRVFQGCNVENASFGLTNCGERTALFKAISEGARDFSEIAIAAHGFPPWPCGSCRQVLAEFNPDMRVLITWDDGRIEQSTVSALLPHGFTPANGVQAALGKDRNE